MITTNAIILRRTNLRDADRIYTLYTERLGKVEAIATGVRKIKSKLCAHLEPCGVVQVTLVRGRMGWRIVNARRETSYLNITTHLDRFVAVMTVFETVDALTKVELPDRRIFSLVHDFLAAHVDLNTLLYALLDALGYRPLPQTIGTSLLLSPAFTDHLHYPLRSRMYYS
ncbi:DNA repair protein RecO [Candidatus Uhrbacteria bacterium]|nr:DNA repair protein RecO [Candidatus Uhrbacteria bacterium]